jgi:formate/nitrite transporter FocA (FNT family)
MDYAKPAEVIAAMIDASEKKLALDPRDLLIRGAISGALLGAATSLAFSGAITTGQPLVGAIIFPVSLVMIVLLGLELVTGSFGLLPLARLEGKAGWSAIGANLSWVFLGNLLGSIAYGICSRSRSPTWEKSKQPLVSRRAWSALPRPRLSPTKRLAWPAWSVFS